MFEVTVTPWLPEGWAGTADWLFWNPEQATFSLGDLKTIKGEGLPYRRGNVSEEHKWQVSAYYNALKYTAHLPLGDEAFVYYLPMNNVFQKWWMQANVIEPLLEPVTPYTNAEVLERMGSRREAVQSYLRAVDATGAIINDALADPMERVQKLVWNGRSRVFDLKLTPHWSNQFCPYAPEYCECGLQKTNKIGHFRLNGQYVPRKGSEDVEPEIEPTEAEYHAKNNTP